MAIIPGSKEYILYELIDPVTNEIRYVGQTSMGLKRRLSCHISKIEKTHKKYWINSLLSKNLKPIINEVKVCYSQEEVNLAEIELIDKYKKEGIKLTNLVSGGNVTSGYKFTEKQKEKMRGRKPHNLGKKVSEKQREEISKSLKEFFILNPKKGIPQSSESKKKIAEKNSKKIALVDDDNNVIKFFNSIKEASIQLNLKESSICKVCKGERNSLFNKKFIYI